MEYSGETADKPQFHLHIAPSLPRNAPLAFECIENASLGNIDFTIHFKKISLDHLRKPLDIWMVKLLATNPDFYIEPAFYTDWEKGQKLYFSDGNFLSYAYLNNEQRVDFSSNGFSFYVTDKKIGMQYGPILPVFELPGSFFGTETINVRNAGYIENLTYSYRFTTTQARWNDYQSRLKLLGLKVCPRRSEMSAIALEKWS